MNNSQKRASQIIQISTLAITTLLLAAAPAYADVIKKFEVNARILKDSPKLDVNESITIDFGKQPRHGLVRLYNPEQQVNIVSTVDQKGTGYATCVNQSEGKTQLRIGSPGTTITGTHIYNIHYTVDGAITRNGTLEWSPTGHNWQQKIEQFQLKLEAPEHASAKAQTVPVSNDGSYHLNATSGGIFQVQKTNITPGHGVDVVAALAPSYKSMAQASSFGANSSNSQSVSSNHSSSVTQVAVVLLILCIGAVWFAIRSMQKVTQGRNSSWTYGSDSYDSYSSCSSCSSCSSSSSSCSSSSSSCSSSSCGGGSSW